MARIIFRLSLGAIICIACIASLKHVSDAKCDQVNVYGLTPHEEEMFRDQTAQNSDLIRTTYALQAAMVVRTQEIASTDTAVKVCVPDTIIEGEEGSPYRVEPTALCKSLYDFAVIFPVIVVNGLPTIGTPTVNGQKLGTTIVHG